VPKLDDIAEETVPELPLQAMEWLGRSVKFHTGGVYLLSGDPGVGKTTIAMQLALDLAAQGLKVLYLTNEQSASDLLGTARRIMAGSDAWANARQTAGANLEIEHLARLEDLEVWRDHVFLPGARWSETKCIVLDSVQGGGLSPTARRGYGILEKFVMAAKAHKITSLLIAHVTKAGAIAGPKDLEHQVDVVLQFKKAFKLRPLFVPKNRYGPAQLDPIPLAMGDSGLYKPALATPTGTSILAVDFGDLLVAPAQAKVQIPRWGEKPGIRAPYLPKEKLRQLVSCLSDLPDVDASELTYQISCLMPGKASYTFGFDVAVVMAILSSYLQRDVPVGTGYYGEVDLHGNVRSPIDGKENEVYEEYSDAEDEEAEEDQKELVAFTGRLKNLKCLIVPTDSQNGLAAWISLPPDSPKIVPVGDIRGSVVATWPDIA
jgi:DNA repair protein RadA/Sms